MNIVAKMHQFERAANTRDRTRFLPDGITIQNGEDLIWSGRIHYDGPVAEAACLHWMRRWLIAEGVMTPRAMTDEQIIANVEIVLGAK